MATSAISTGGLDVPTLVSQLVTAERTTYQTPITARETKATVQLSAVSSLKGALSSFQTTVAGLKDAANFTPRSTSSSDEDVFTATSTGDASTGSYDVQVIALAKAQQLASSAFTAGSTAVVGTGKLTVTYGDKTFDVNIDSTNNTLAGVRDAINKATGNTGVQATILNEQGGSHLVLTSAQTGAASTIKIAASGGDGGLAQLAYNGVDTASMTQVQAAQDAHIKIANFDHYSSTNVVTDAVDDVTLSLKSTSTDPVTLSITEDTASLKQKVTQFVQAYNQLYSTFTNLRSYDANSKAAGPLLGDALLRGIEGQIGLDLSNPVSGVTGPYTTLASIGVTRQADGMLGLDSAKLDKALTADRTSVAKVFGGDNGVAARLSTDLTSALKSGGAIDARTTSLNADLKKVQDDNDALDARMQVLSDRYTRQYTALDTLLTQMQGTSDFLTSQLASLPGGSSK
ncbi:MAG: flagellar filament capping protein FliD [Gammaproteobacteria bacterium]